MKYLELFTEEQRKEIECATWIINRDIDYYDTIEPTEYNLLGHTIVIIDDILFIIKDNKIVYLYIGCELGIDYIYVGVNEEMQLFNFSFNSYTTDVCEDVIFDCKNGKVVDFKYIIHDKAMVE